MKIMEEENQDEFIITRHNKFNPPINIVNIYGETESRNSNEKISERWLKICD